MVVYTFYKIYSTHCGFNDNSKTIMYSRQYNAGGEENYHSETVKRKIAVDTKIRGKMKKKMKKKE